MANLLEKFLGDPNKKALNKIQPLVLQVNGWEEKISALSDEDLANQTVKFRERLEKGEDLDSLLPEAFATVRETAKRVLGERHYDVQLVGGIALHQGKIAEMRTGEGKTLVATLPVYLNALTGKGVYVVTVNDYLAKRDAEWMGQVYNFLGLTVGVVTHDLKQEDRKAAYASDITYGTNNEFGFDYLRDNMVGTREEQVQRNLNFAIVDEVDSILIDEARTPLIISAPDEESTGKYLQFAKIAPQLTAESDYILDEKQKSAVLTEAGIDKVQKLLGIKDIYESGDIVLAHHIEQALRAQTLYKKDVDYVVKDGEVLIVDEFTGRLMQGRRYSEGLHQAIEAKEGVEVKRESKTLATITFQNYFRLFNKLGGMTGTAKTEEEEFWKIYGLEVVVIPTNRDLARIDANDLIYINERAKFNAVVEEVARRHESGQPVLVGTIAIEKSELLSGLLKMKGVPHSVLNAKQHEREAEIIKDAGQKGSVTIATNMAGRGTDIKLGEGVQDLGGLAVIGTERHESRRIDNQLRGRSGRQGDPGYTLFLVSLEDDLMRLFGSERLKSMMKTLKIPEDQPLEHRMITSSIESAQKRVEGHNFDIRKRVVEYDDVMNRHRETIYKQRQDILEDADVKQVVQDYVGNELLATVAEFIPEDGKATDMNALIESVNTFFSVSDSFKQKLSELPTKATIEEALFEESTRLYEEREKESGNDDQDIPVFRQAERIVLLRVIDALWMEHLDAMMKLREAIGLAGYGQRDPLTEYKQEAYMMFQRLQGAIAFDVARLIYKVRIAAVDNKPKSPEVEARENPENLELQGGEEPTGDFTDEVGEIANLQISKSANNDAPSNVFADKPLSPTHQSSSLPAAVRDPDDKKEKIGRNDPCWCGSGKKFKKCHGA